MFFWLIWRQLKDNWNQLTFSNFTTKRNITPNVCGLLKKSWTLTMTKTKVEKFLSKIRKFADFTKEFWWDCQMIWWKMTHCGSRALEWEDYWPGALFDRRHQVTRPSTTRPTYFEAYIALHYGRIFKRHSTNCRCFFIKVLTFMSSEQKLFAFWISEQFVFFKDVNFWLKNYFHRRIKSSFAYLQWKNVS